MKKTGSLLIVFVLILTTSTLFALGALSRDGLAPTQFSPTTTGTTSIADSVVGFPDVAYFTVNVPAGHQLDAIRLIDDSTGDGTYWFAIMSGNQFTENSTNSGQINVNNLLGHAHIGTAQGDLNQNLLPEMGTNGQGFTLPLSEGAYSFRIQNWGSGGTFALDAEISATPTTAVTALHGITDHGTSLPQITLAIVFTALATIGFYFLERR